MTEWEKAVYADMKSVDRVLLYMVKIVDMMEFQKILTKEDIDLIVAYVKQTKRGDGNG